MRPGLVITVVPSLFDTSLDVEVVYRRPDGSLAREWYRELSPDEADDLVLVICDQERDDRY